VVTFVFVIIWDSPVTKTTRLCGGDAGLNSWQGIFRFDTASQIRLGVPLASYAMDSGNSLPKSKAAVHPNLMHGTYNPIHLHAMAWCLLQHRENFSCTAFTCTGN
jgi:hypothetical protein